MYRMETTLGWFSLRRCFTSVSLTSRTFLTATWSWPSRPRNTAPCEPLPSHVRSEMFSNGTSHSSSTAHTHTWVYFGICIRITASAVRIIAEQIPGFSRTLFLDFQDFPSPEIWFTTQSTRQDSTRENLKPCGLYLPHQNVISELILTKYRTTLQVCYFDCMS